MKSKKLPLILTVAAVVYTLLAWLVDRQAIGAGGTMVGLAHINQVLTPGGLNRFWFDLTQVLAYVAMALVFVRAGYCLFVRKKIDFAFFAMAAVAVVLYVVFDKLLILNYRPVIMDVELESSYPSTHTLVICTFFGMTAFVHGEKTWMRWAILGIALFGAVARLLSGVHWFTDIIGGILISATLVSWYVALRGKDQ